MLQTEFLRIVWHQNSFEAASRKTQPFPNFFSLKHSSFSRQPVAFF